MSQTNHPEVNQNLLDDLPFEIIINILSRLPARTVISCKFVCKSWLSLIESHEFINAHLSKAAPLLTVYVPRLNLYELFEIEDGHDIEHHDLHYDSVTKFSLPYRAWLSGSANGLLFLCNQSTRPDSLYVCNPITRDYIGLHFPREFNRNSLAVVTCGFGASKITGQHKVVAIFQDYVRYDPERSPLLVRPKSECECHVYTIGTGSWRRAAPVDSLLYECRSSGAFVNGNLHWLVYLLSGAQQRNYSFDLEEERFSIFCPPPLPLRISCFDLEAELFSTFSPPPPPLGSCGYDGGLFALRDCLCFCDNLSRDEIVIWLMKDYGVESSWTKEFVIAKDPVVFEPFDNEYYNGVVSPVKVFEDGDILMAWDQLALFYYSGKNNTVQKVGMFEQHTDILACLYTPSFLSLKGLEMENVISF